MGRLTTHILDTARGIPAAGVAVRLYVLGDERELRATGTTNADGRTDSPLLDGESLETASYELEFDIGSYFKASDIEAGEPPFAETRQSSDSVPMVKRMVSSDPQLAPRL